MNDTSTEAEGAVIHVGDPAALSVPDSVLDAPGGFAWWYVDALDAAGDGLVLIWSYGLPFLPGYLSGARAGRGDPAKARPSLNLAVYEGGRPAFYLLQAYDPQDVSMTPDGRFRFGRSHIVRETGRVHLDLDCPLPGTRDRLRGQVEVQGPAARLGPGLSPSPLPDHRWTPVLGPARVAADLAAGPRRFRVDAPAYHDRNEGRRRFDDLGIDHWIWGRLVTEQRTRIWYLCYAKTGPSSAWGVELAADGEVRMIPDLSPRIERPRTGAFGLRTWDTVTLVDGSGEPWVRARTGRRVDDGFFYARTVVEVTAGSEAGLGLAEWIVPDRIDLPRHRPLVRMAVHDASGPNSMWLPLFSGSRAGRWARLMGLRERRGTRRASPPPGEAAS